MTPEDDVTSVLREILAWTRIQALPAAREALATTLVKDEHKIIYQESKGDPAGLVAKKTGVGESTVNRVWKRAFKAGLMREDPKNPGRYLRTFDLEDFELLPKDPKAKGKEPEDGQ